MLELGRPGPRSRPLDHGEYGGADRRDPAPASRDPLGGGGCHPAVAVRAEPAWALGRWGELRVQNRCS